MIIILRNSLTDLFLHIESIGFETCNISVFLYIVKNKIRIIEEIVFPQSYIYNTFIIYL